MLQSGQILNETYRIERLLGSGGMADVFVVSHVRLPRRFALKLLRLDATASGYGAQFLERFRREAEILAQLDHPNIVNVIDWNHTDGNEPYLVMDLLDGYDLSHHLKRTGSLELASALRIAFQIGDALRVAHAAGVVHRDLKPSNIFLCRNGPYPDFVKVLDFGIAKLARQERSASMMTAQRAVIGTPAYMSPEQALGRVEEIDERTDQFAIAAIVYEMLSGRPAFYRTGEPAFATLARVVQEAPEPLPDRRVNAVLSKALSKAREERYSSIAAFLDALRSSADIGTLAASMKLEGVSRCADDPDAKPCSLDRELVPVSASASASADVTQRKATIAQSILLSARQDQGRGYERHPLAGGALLLFLVTFLLAIFAQGGAVDSLWLLGSFVPGSILAVFLSGRLLVKWLRSRAARSPFPLTWFGATPTQLVVGQCFDGYRILRKLGESNLCDVFEVVHAELGLPGALHLLRQRIASDKTSIARLLNGVKAVNSIQHPGIARVLCSRRHVSGITYVVTEYLRGALLREHIDRAEGALPAEDAVAIGKQLASALAAAHEKGIVHRGLTPSKILLVDEQSNYGKVRAKILDFDIAKLLSDHQVHNAEPVQTLCGEVIGTTLYMAPEQCVGSRGIDAKVDVYILGILLYEMLSGRSPLGGDGIDQARRSLMLKQFPRLRDLRPALTAELSELVHLLLARDPEERPSMREAELGLSALLNLTTDAAPSQEPFDSVEKGVSATESAHLASRIPAQPSMPSMNGSQTNDTAQETIINKYDIFLCYNSADKSAVKLIYEQLRQRGLRPWLDQYDLRPGLPWQDELERQIARIGSAAVFVGNSGIGPWQDMEQKAFLQAFKRRGCPVIPVILADAQETPDLPIFLRGMTWVDFRRSDCAPIDQLLWGITGERAFISM